MLAYKNMSVGKLFSLSFYNDDPFIVAAGGDKGVLGVWESDEQTAISERFETRILTEDQVNDKKKEFSGLGDFEISITGKPVCEKNINKSKNKS